MTTRFVASLFNRSGRDKRGGGKGEEAGGGLGAGLVQDKAIIFYLPRGE